MDPGGASQVPPGPAPRRVPLDASFISIMGGEGILREAKNLT